MTCVSYLEIILSSSVRVLWKVNCPFSLPMINLLFLYLSQAHNLLTFSLFHPSMIAFISGCLFFTDDRLYLCTVAFFCIHVQLPFTSFMSNRLLQGDISLPSPVSDIFSVTFNITLLFDYFVVNEIWKSKEQNQHSLALVHCWRSRRKKTQCSETLLAVYHSRTSIL